MIQEEFDFLSQDLQIQDGALPCYSDVRLTNEWFTVDVFLFSRENYYSVVNPKSVALGY